MKKRILTILLATVLALSLTGCSDSSSRSDSESSRSESSKKSSNANKEEAKSDKIHFGATVTLEQIRSAMKGAKQTIVAMKTKDKDEFLILQGPDTKTSGIPFISADKPAKDISDVDPFLGDTIYSIFLYPAVQQLEFNFSKHELVYFTTKTEDLMISIYDLADPESPYAAPFFFSRKEPGSIYYDNKNPYDLADGRSPKELFDASLLDSNVETIKANNGPLITLNNVTINGTPVEDLEDQYFSACNEGEPDDEMEYFYLTLPSGKPFKVRGEYDDNATFEATFMPGLMVSYDDDRVNIDKFCEIIDDEYAIVHLEKSKEEFLDELGLKSDSRLIIGNAVLYFTED